MIKNKNRIILFFVFILLGITYKVMPAIYYSQGLNSYEKEDYVSAYKSFKKAYHFNQKNKDYRYYYITTLAQQPPTIKVQMELFKFASNEPNDSAQQIAETKISDWRNSITYNIGDNYIEQAPSDNGIIRWDKSKFPLKINITDKTNSDLPSYYQSEIMRAFQQWQSSTGFITFAKTNSETNADISIQISPTPSNLCTERECRYVVGYTVPRYSGKLLKKMDITLYNKDPYGNFFSDKELYNTILHEIGHALGIMGHSYSSEDLMYMSTTSNNYYAPYRSSFQYLSSKDINTINLLYKLTPTITNSSSKELDTQGMIYAPIVLGTQKEITSRKLKEAKNYIKNAPDLATGYIDLAIVYAELGKYKNAVKSLNKAIELSKNDNEKYIALYNLAVINLNNNYLEESLKYAKDAQQISSTEEIKDLITNINHAKATNKNPFKINLPSN